MKDFRVVTLNIWNRGDPWEERLGVIRRGIRALDPDVVLLQEVLSMKDIDFDQAALIGGEFGYHIAFGQSSAALYPFGNAILSRWPIAKKAVFDLPNGGTEENRSLLFCELDAPFARVPVFTTHLNWKLNEGHVRIEQIRFVVDKIEELVPEGSFPPVLGGDMNAEPDADEMRFVRGLTPLGRAKCVHFADCFATAGDGTPGYTFARRNPYAAVCREPDRRIDYIFVRGSDDRFRGEPLEAKICFDEPEGGVWATDHFGVYARIGT